MRQLTFLLLSLLLFESLGSSLAPTARWPRFRGPNGSGIAETDKPPIEFGPSIKLLWKCPLPPGHSSPIVWDDHIFLTGIENKKLALIAIQRRDGKLLWKQTIPTEQIEPVHPFSNPAASTPATDGQRVYAYFGSFGLLAFDFNGREVWRKPLPLPPNKYGTATSPIVWDDKVILQLDGNTTNSSVLAVEAKTGATVWQTARPTLRESWSTPIIWRNQGQEELITIGQGWLMAYSPKNGKERWQASGFTFQPIGVAVTNDKMLFASTSGTGSPADPVEMPKWDWLIENYDRNKDGKLAPDEVTAEMGIVLRKEVPKETAGNFLPLRSLLKDMLDRDRDGAVTKAEWDAAQAGLAASHDTVMAIRPGGSGDITQSHVAWKARRGISEMPSPIFYRGRLYFVRDGGMVTSYDPETGQVILDRQRLGVLGQYCASPVAADGRIYAASETGTVIVFRAADKLEVLARNELGESIIATPAIADHKLYLRTDKHLWAFGE